ncbi:MAG: AAA family ATPase [Pseudomonadota bacterium]
MILRRRKETRAELVVACDDLDAFSGLRAELERAFEPGAWVAVAPADLAAALPAAAPPAALVAVASDDQDKLDEAAELIGAARAAGAHVLLVVEDLPPAALHGLMRAGADDFLPAPVAEGAIAESLAAIARAAAPAPTGGPGPASRDGIVIAVYGVAGGVGATTFAVNLAYELALEGRKPGLRVCLMDLDFQYGAAATYLDMSRRESVYELLTSLERLDGPGLQGGLADFNGQMDVLTAPLDVLPLDIVGQDSVATLLDLARGTHDVVIVDLPRTLTLWTETVLQVCERFHAVMEIDMRSAQNMLRFLRTVKAEDLPMEKIDYVLNRAPGFGDFSSRNRVKKMSESLGIEYGLLLPDGGKSVVQACDHGAPLAEFAGSNALRKEIRKAARAVMAEIVSAKAAIA